MSEVKAQAGRAFRRSAAFLWVTALSGIGFWMVHITAVSGLVEYTCNEKGTLWWIHLATILTVVPTLLALRACRNLVRHSEDEEGEGTLSGNYAFVGIFGVITNGFSVLLIALEGSYAFFLSPCA